MASWCPLLSGELIPQELAYRRPSIQKATDWQNQLSKSTAISKSQSSDSPNGINHTNSAVEGSDDGLTAARYGLGVLLVLGGVYTARKLLRR